MEITKDKLLEGTATIIKDKEFLPTKEYVSPFIEEMSRFTDEFIIRVEEPNQKLITDQNDNTTFNKVWIQAIMPGTDDIKEIYNLAYSLDVRTPLYKVFKHYTYDGNPVLFQANWINTEEIKDGTKLIYNIPYFMSLTNDIPSKVEKMKKCFIDDPHKALGEMSTKALMYEFRNIGGKVKLPSSMPLKAYEMVYMDDSSPYYVKSTEESSAWNYYQAYTSLVKDASKKDLMSMFEKTWLVSSLFNQYHI